ncbi:MAG: hypothetical protein A2Z25_09345 [Planctomycetes bacterium RBG_16_55_9]|nr:MAG: hypothetical protein A2Z25_09345 [Planctomycetes bacterium RBG_16_55_9]
MIRIGKVTGKEDQYELEKIVKQRNTSSRGKNGLTESIYLNDWTGQTESFRLNVEKLEDERFKLAVQKQ